MGRVPLPLPCQPQSLSNTIRCGSQKEDSVARMTWGLSTRHGMTQPWDDILSRIRGWQRRPARVHSERTVRGWGLLSVSAPHLLQLPREAPTPR